MKPVELKFDLEYCHQNKNFDIFNILDVDATLIEDDHVSNTVFWILTPAQFFRIVKDINVFLKNNKNEYCHESKNWNNKKIFWKLDSVRFACLYQLIKIASGKKKYRNIILHSFNDIILDYIKRRKYKKTIYRMFDYDRISDIDYSWFRGFYFDKYQKGYGRDYSDLMEHYLTQKNAKYIFENQSKFIKLMSAKDDPDLSMRLLSGKQDVFSYTMYSLKTSPDFYPFLYKILHVVKKFKTSKLVLSQINDLLIGKNLIYKLPRIPQKILDKCMEFDELRDAAISHPDYSVAQRILKEINDNSNNLTII